MNARVINNDITLMIGPGGAPSLVVHRLNTIISSSSINML